MVITTEKLRFLLITHKGIQYVVLNICGTHPCCYVNLPEDHLNCETHYEGDKRVVDVSLPGNWIGWDYAHSGDFNYYPGAKLFPFEKTYTTTELIEECKKVIDQVVEAYEK